MKMYHQDIFICALANELHGYYMSVIMLQNAPEMLDAHTRAVGQMVDRITIALHETMVCDLVMSVGNQVGTQRGMLDAIKRKAVALLDLSHGSILAFAERTLVFDLKNPEITELTLQEPEETYADFLSEFEKAYQAVLACCDDK